MEGFSGEIIFLALLGFVLFGPRKLPEIVRTVGRFAADLKRASSQFQEQITREVGPLEPDNPSKSLLGSLADDFKALHSSMREPAKAMMALAVPLAPKQQGNGASLIDNVDRIKALLDGNGTAAEPHDAAAKAAETVRAEAASVAPRAPGN